MLHVILNQCGLAITLDLNCKTMMSYNEEFLVPCDPVCVLQDIVDDSTAVQVEEDDELDDVFSSVSLTSCLLCSLPCTL